MNRKSFTKNPNFCLIDKSFSNPKSECVFDSWSIQHFYWQGFIYLIMHHLLNIKNIKEAILLCILITILHAIEEYSGNREKKSVEGVVINHIGPLIIPEIKPEKREIDNDYLDNSIGDVLSGFIANILIILYWCKYNKLPYFYIIGLVPVIIHLFTKAHILI